MVIHPAMDISLGCVLLPDDGAAFFTVWSTQSKLTKSRNAAGMRAITPCIAANSNRRVSRGSTLQFRQDDTVVPLK